MENAGANLWDSQNYSSFNLSDDGLGLFEDVNYDFDLQSFPLSDLDYSSTVQFGKSAADLSSGDVSSFQAETAPPLPSSDHTNGSTYGHTLKHSSVISLESLDSSPTMLSRCLDTDHPTSSQSQKASLKRKIEESVVVFSSTDDKKFAPRKRKAFSQSRKTEVALNRMIGACIQCKIRKSACNFGVPCKPCITRAGSAPLGQQLCMRQSLLAIRFDHMDIVNPTMLELEVKDVNALLSIPQSHTSYLWFIGSRSVPDAFLKVHVIDFEASDFNSNRLVISVDYFCRSVSTVPDSRHALDPRKLPSIDELQKVYERSRENSQPRTGPFSSLQQAIERFVIHYCGRPAELPMEMPSKKSLLSKIIRLQGLFGMYRRIPASGPAPTCEEPQLVSTTMSAQLRLLVCDELKILEAEIFSNLDRLMYGQGSIGRENPLAIWACLWTLLFTYKEHMIYTRSTLPELDISPAVHTARYKLSQHLYNTLTSMYAALYKTTSPLTFDWRIKEIADMLDQDLQLVRLFCEIKTEMYWFYVNRNTLLEEDALFKSLILENENKLVRAHVKVAKRRGIL